MATNPKATNLSILPHTLNNTYCIIILEYVSEPQAEHAHSIVSAGLMTVSFTIHYTKAHSCFIPAIHDPPQTRLLATCTHTHTHTHTRVYTIDHCTIITLPTKPRGFVAGDEIELSPQALYLAGILPHTIGRNRTTSMPGGGGQFTHSRGRMAEEKHGIPPLLSHASQSAHDKRP